MKRHGGMRVAVTALVPFALLASVDGAAQSQDDPPATTSAPSTRPISGFRLPPANDGRAPGVQGPSDNGLPPASPGQRQPTPTPTPVPTPAPIIAPPVVAPSTAPTPRDAPARATPAPARRDTQAAPAATRPATASPAVPAQTPSTPPAAEVESPPPESPTALPAGQDGDGALAAPETRAAPTSAPSFGWAWILAAMALLGGGVWFWRNRRVAQSVDGPDLAPPPVKPRAAPAAAPRAPQPPMAKTAAPRPATRDDIVSVKSPLVTRPVAERRASLTMDLEISHINMAASQIGVAFKLTLRNTGSADAVGVLVRLALQQGSQLREEVLARFYDGAGGSILRDDLTLAVGGEETVATEAMLPRDMFDAIMIDGKPMLVPVLAFDVTYHWDGPADAFGQTAKSYVIGRESPEGKMGRLGPLRLDQPARTIKPVGARATEVQRNQ